MLAFLSNNPATGMVVSTRAAPPVMNEAAAKAAWLSKLEQPAWGAPRSAAEAPASLMTPPNMVPGDATRDTAESVKKAPKAGWTLTTAGGARTMEDLHKDKEKARKSYQGKEIERDIDRTTKGW